MEITIPSAMSSTTRKMDEMMEKSTRSMSLMTWIVVQEKETSSTETKQNYPRQSRVRGYVYSCLVLKCLGPTVNLDVQTEETKL